MVLALVSIAGAPAFPLRPLWAPCAAVGSAVQAVWLHHSSVRCPSGVVSRHGPRLGSVFRARGLSGARQGGGACRARAGARAGDWATGR